MHMLRKNKLVALLAMALIAPCAVARHAPSVVVDAAGIRHESGRVVLLMSVTNCSSIALHVDAGNLPWGENTIGLTLRRASEMPGGELRQLIPVRHSAPEEVVIPPQGRVNGSIDLTERFPDLSSVEKYKEFVLFWTYNTTLLSKNGGQQVSGVVNYPGDTARSSAAGNSVAVCIKSP